MLSIYNLKPKFQSLLRPVLRFLYQKRVTANQITICSIILSAAIGIAFWFADIYPFLFLVLPVGLFVRMALNALDGMMARTYNQQTKAGELINEVGDIVSDLFIFFPLLKHEQAHVYLISIFIFLSVVNEFCGVMGKVLGGQRRYEGPMGKSDRAFVIGLYGLLSFFLVDLSNVIFPVLLIIIALLVFSTIVRIKKTLLIV
jgi:CDP-diacylglycerol--glycerol-3-phosphate 3-phosphatidyltransferase